MLLDADVLLCWDLLQEFLGRGTTGIWCPNAVLGDGSDKTFIATAGHPLKSLTCGSTFHCLVALPDVTMENKTELRTAAGRAVVPDLLTAVRASTW